MQKNFETIWPHDSQMLRLEKETGHALSNERHPYSVMSCNGRCGVRRWIIGSFCSAEPSVDAQPPIPYGNVGLRVGVKFDL